MTIVDSDNIVLDESLIPPIKGVLGGKVFVTVDKWVIYCLLSYSD